MFKKELQEKIAGILDVPAEKISLVHIYMMDLVTQLQLQTQTIVNLYIHIPLMVNSLHFHMSHQAMSQKIL